MPRPDPCLPEQRTSDAEFGAVCHALAASLIAFEDAVLHCTPEQRREASSSCPLPDLGHSERLDLRTWLEVLVEDAAAAVQVG